MNEQLELALEEARQPFADPRFNVCRLEIIESDGRYRLEGTVLDGSTLDAVLNHLHSRVPDARWDRNGVRVLRQARPRLMAVATNLTGWQRDPSWLGEQQSQVLNGTIVEILEEGERWSFGRLEDGYLGYVYTGYLGSTGEAPEPTHVVSHPVTLLWPESGAGPVPVGRVFAGTRVAAAMLHDGRAEVTLAGGLCGYAAPGELRPLNESLTVEERRWRLIQDTLPYIGVPYLWGGTSAHGIDCSGFAQLMHKLAGVTIPRDADSQFYAGQPVEPPYAAGDLLYFGAKDGHRSVTHVGISLGPDQDPDGMVMIHSGRSRNGVYVDDINALDSLRESFLGGRRFLRE
jgi:hypothetical protein